MRNLIISLIFLLSCTISHAERLFLPFLTAESQSNVIVTADPEHPKPCPLEYTNLISNTNLFSSEERNLLKEIPLKYKNVTTNTGPVGTVFKGIELRQWKFRGKIIQTFPVSLFEHTNSNAREEIAFFNARQTLVNFRNQSGNGYNVNLTDGRLSAYEGYKSNVLDGLYVGQVFDQEHCNYWAHFAQGKIAGKFLSWNEKGELGMDAEFPRPFDFLKNEAMKFDLTWEKVPTPSTNSIIKIR